MSPRSACPDLTADLRTSLASQPQRTAEKRSRLHQAPTENAADGAALHREQCQLEVSIPSPAVTALTEVTALQPSCCCSVFSGWPPNEQK